MVFSVTSMALGANGSPFILGKAKNITSKVTGLVGNVADTTKAPLKVSTPNAGTATNLSADKLDGLDSTGFVQGRGLVQRSAVGILPGGTTSGIDHTIGGSEGPTFVYNCPSMLTNQVAQTAAS